MRLAVKLIDSIALFLSVGLYFDGKGRYINLSVKRCGMKGFLLKLKNFKIKRNAFIAVLALVLVAASVFFIFLKHNKKSKAATDEYISAVVKKSDIALKISGSGTVEPILRYEIISLVRGEVLSCNFEEGDSVNEGDILYKIDSTDLQNTILKQRNSIEKAMLTVKTNRENIENLKVRAPISGILSNFQVKEGDTVKPDNAGVITDNTSFTATIPFNASQLGKIKAGDRATITSALYMTELEGTVTYKSNVASVSADGSLLYNVEISLKNPGSLSSGVSVGAMVHTADGDVKSPVSGMIANIQTASVMPKVSGKIIKVYAKDNEFVNKGDILFQVDGADYTQAQERTNLELRDLQLSLETYNKELENYNIKAPISGVVVSKQYKTGDTIGGSQNSSATLMTIANTSSMVFNLDVDELEISRVAVGQSAEITGDALPGQRFMGSVTKIAKEGVSQNGVTTYKVELMIAEPGDLISGMNVNAEIIVAQSKDALVVPISAVTGIKDGVGNVLVKANAQGDYPKEGEGNSAGAYKSFSGADAAQGGRTFSGNTGAARGRGEDNENRQGSETVRDIPHRREAATGGYVLKNVEVGISNNDYIEILDGLKEGEQVFYRSAISSGNQSEIPGRGNTHFGGGNMGMPNMRYGR